MLTDINPKLPMRDKNVTKAFYTNEFGFNEFRNANFDDYLMIEKDQIYFFKFKEFDPKENYRQVYIRTKNIESFYQSLLDNNTRIHPNGPLEIKP